MLRIEETINAIKVNVDFKNKLNVMFDESGTGKTFLYSLITSFCVKNQIPYVYFDYRNVSNIEGNISKICKGADIVMFDNADLYMRKEIIQDISALDITIIVSIKDITLLKKIDDFGVYKIEHKDKEIRTCRVIN